MEKGKRFQAPQIIRFATNIDDALGIAVPNMEAYGWRIQRRLI